MADSLKRVFDYSDYLATPDDDVWSRFSVTIFTGDCWVRCSTRRST